MIKISCSTDEEYNAMTDLFDGITYRDCEKILDKSKGFTAPYDGYAFQIVKEEIITK